jgi:hypothetical protein
VRAETDKRHSARTIVTFVRRHADRAGTTLITGEWSTSAGLPTAAAQFLGLHLRFLGLSRSKQTPENRHGSRRKFLGSLANTGKLILPIYFPNPSAGCIRTEGHRFCDVC